jgi:hypothetical protein
MRVASLMRALAGAGRRIFTRIHKSTARRCCGVTLAEV